jgi:hypothetical protein
MKDWPRIWSDAFLGAFVVFLCIAIINALRLTEFPIFPFAYALFCLAMSIVMLFINRAANERKDPGTG